MIGRAIRMRVPGYGDYYLLPRPAGDAAGEMAIVDRNVLRIQSGGVHIEITGEINLLQKAERRLVWVYHVPESQLGRKVDSADFVCADNLEQLKSAGY